MPKNEPLDGCEILHQLIDGKHPILIPFFTVFHSYLIVSKWLWVKILVHPNGTLDSHSWYSWMVSPQTIHLIRFDPSPTDLQRNP